MADVNIPGQGIHNVVYVATEHDSVYAFDANGLSSAPLWHVSFINPAAGVTTVPAADTGETGDIPNEIGITGTPVIDPTTGTLYVVAATKEVVDSTTTYVQRLHALDITTGAEKFGGPVVIQASVPGTGPGSSGGQLPFDSLHENQRTGLLLSNGVVYFGFSSHGDVEPYHGWVMGYNATTLQQVMVYCDTPNANDGGIWMDGDGIATDSTGNLYFITGDGSFDVNTGGKDYGDTFVKTQPHGHGPGLLHAHRFRPRWMPAISTWGRGECCCCRLKAGHIPTRWSAPARTERSTSSTATTWGTTTRAQTGSFSLGQHLPQYHGAEGGNFSSPVYFNGYVYFSPVAGTVQAFQLTNGLLSTAPTSQSSEIYSPVAPGTGRGGTMSISANGSSNGILWTLQDTGTTSRVFSTPTTRPTWPTSCTTATRPGHETRSIPGSSSASRSWRMERSSSRPIAS